MNAEKAGGAGKAPRVVSFEDLDVFKRASRVSLDVHRASLEMPKIEQLALADPMRRASKSICSNLAEGYGRQKQSKAEFRRFVWMAIGSSDEMRVWARLRARSRLCRRRNLAALARRVSDHFEAAAGSKRRAHAI